MTKHEGKLDRDQRSDLKHRTSNSGKSDLRAHLEEFDQDNAVPVLDENDPLYEGDDDPKDAEEEAVASEPAPAV